MKKIELLNINISSGSTKELDSEVRSYLSNSEQRLILNTNIHGMNLSRKHNWMANFFNSSDVVLCDGTGVLWASKLAGRGIKERISLTDWGWPFAEILEETGHSVFLLGEPQYVIDKSVKNLKERYPSLKVSGARSGFFDVNGKENSEIIDSINSSGADVLMVGMGMPRQEKWVLDNKEKLNVKLIVTVGAMFRYYSGHYKRSPFWVSKIGLEWFHRFLKDPVNLFSRYFPGNFTFFFRVIKSRISR
ncbi:MAG: WecB/TagA/CpsF family glycosyltransferase [Acidobacteriota bacterium]